jgi:hypothetical protein
MPEFQVRHYKNQPDFDRDVSRMAKRGWAVARGGVHRAPGGPLSVTWVRTRQAGLFSSLFGLRRRGKPQAQRDEAGDVDFDEGR